MGQLKGVYSWCEKVDVNSTSSDYGNQGRIKSESGGHAIVWLPAADMLMMGDIYVLQPFIKLPKSVNLYCSFEYSLMPSEMDGPFFFEV